MGIPTITLMEIIIRCPQIFESNIKEFISSQKNFNAMIEEKLLKIDDLARNVDRISLDVDSLKLTSIPPKHDINDSLKAMRISIDECKERTDKMRAKKDWFIKACYSSFYENKDEDLKVINVSPIKSLFCNMNLDNDGTGDESISVKRRPNDSEFLDLDAKLVKVGLRRSKLYIAMNPLFWISRNLIMIIVI